VEEGADVGVPEDPEVAGERSPGVEVVYDLAQELEEAGALLAPRVEAEAQGVEEFAGRHAGEPAGCVHVDGAEGVLRPLAIDRVHGGAAQRRADAPAPRAALAVVAGTVEEGGAEGALVAKEALEVHRRLIDRLPAPTPALDHRVAPGVEGREVPRRGAADVV